MEIGQCTRRNSIAYSTWRFSLELPGGGCRTTKPIALDCLFVEVREYLIVNNQYSLSLDEGEYIAQYL